MVEAENQRNTLLDEIRSRWTKRLKRTAREEPCRAVGSARLEIEPPPRRGPHRFFQERILTEYHVALPSLTAEQVGTDEYDDDDARGAGRGIAHAASAHGTVNVGAIEEYDTLEKRDDFLGRRRTTCSQARQTLLDVVARIDKTIREMFLDTFNEVANTSASFFRRLFNGGQARIYLLDEDDPLECGIEIEARPPGKKPQSISLLSGGEQAMTAIALLFAIFNAKPSPFCVLDEVDAPLDDANIERFLDMLDGVHRARASSSSSRTASRPWRSADALYGVTHDRYALGKVAGLVNVAPAIGGDVVGEELQRHGGHDGAERLEALGDVDHIFAVLLDFLIAHGGDRQHDAAARADFLDVRTSSCRRRRPAWRRRRPAALGSRGRWGRASFRRRRSLRRGCS